MKICNICNEREALPNRRVCQKCRNKARRELVAMKKKESLPKAYGILDKKPVFKMCKVCNKRHAEPLRNECAICRNRKHKAKQKALRDKIEEKKEEREILESNRYEGLKMKKCSCCNVLKHERDFGKMKGKDERSDRCKECSKNQRTKTDYVKNPHKINREIIVDNFFGY